MKKLDDCTPLECSDSSIKKEIRDVKTKINEIVEHLNAKESNENFNKTNKS